jgi:DNA repair exonuclease SbcCD ATPase subunit
MNSRITELRSLLDQCKGKQQQLQQTLTNTQAELKQNQRALRNHEQARELIRIAGETTQRGLSYHISEITSLALEAVFDDPYSLDVQFCQRRNKTECDLLFTRDGNTVDPMDASGGGAVDVAAFALRVASWSMMNPRLRNTIILDEPMKNLSKDMQDKASLMLKEVSKKLGLQFIIVTHEEQLAAYADRTFLVTKNKKGISKVTVLEKEMEEIE